jgi:hypothetical protein
MGVGFRAWDKNGFSALGQDDLLCLLGMLSGFQPSLRPIHDDLEINFILEATDKEFLEESIYHVLCSESQVLKGNNEIFQYSRLFQLGQTS